MVFVNDAPVELYRGMQIEHALIARDNALYQAFLAGELTVEDAHGFAAGLDGALSDRARIYTRERRKS